MTAPDPRLEEIEGSAHAIWCTSPEPKAEHIATTTSNTKGGERG